MATLSKSAIYDAGKRSPEVPRIVYFNGERRNERYASGVTERFVDLNGNVVTCQLLGPGIARDPDKIQRARTELRRHKTRDGLVQAFIEHDKCPLRHGTRHLSSVVEEEFAEMPEALQRPCAEDPQVSMKTKKGIQYSEGCPHVQWLIVERTKKAKARVLERRGEYISPAETERQKLELARQQVDETRKVNERLVQAVEQVSTKQSRKAPSE